MQTVSLISLIATPERFHQEQVTTFGFLTARFESNALYLSREDAEHLIVANSLWLDFEESSFNAETLEDLNRRFVLVEGVFDMNARGHLSLRPGSIKDIKRVELMKNQVSEVEE